MSQVKWPLLNREFVQKPFPDANIRHHEREIYNSFLVNPNIHDVHIEQMSDGKHLPYH